VPLPHYPPVKYDHLPGQQMLSTFTKLIQNEDGATAIEYGLIAALIAVAAIAAFKLVGTNLSSIFNTVASDL
jgi:pilus assembly protein Flp/PilA